MITYRKPIDALEIFTLADQSFEGSPWTQKAFETDLANKWTDYSVLLQDNEPVGFASGTLIADELSISHVAIIKAQQGLGLGKILLSEWLAHFPANTRALLEVRAGNQAARRLYEKIGFTSYYVREGYYHNPTEDAVMMEYFTTGKESHDS
ncbi:ribosomal protein S18-alanine N-acetyltransferase [Weissella ceti]|uniref:[Ribosomal protein bS18]-alanine N-acetyltransferase n=1 Tax=Weissella ceti TaxID=759620 RepID=A0ABT3E4J2_9LACO|nr:ribosomal protein S18-alanine N-acetyltransferase [Weissella ceti]MCW0953329.1 ribosomal protein S18-alanine N-acetyltransferase [Weissella ceti]QVK11934.1 ribosomal protein S18-alanine N-acetyltransferase [Weissella ceti]